MAKADKMKAIKSKGKEAVSAAKKESKHKIVKGEDDSAAAAAAVSLPFEMNHHHKKALSKLLHCHHTDQVLTYSELSSEIGAGEKTKAWQCIAWKDLKNNEYIVPSPNKASDGKALFMLSEKGVKLASTLASDEELAEYKMPETNEEHHEKIKARLVRQEKAKKYGPKIFDLLVETQDDAPMTKHELAAKLNTNPDSHGFFYGFQTLKKMGLICNAEVSSSKAKSKGSLDKTDDTEDKTSEEMGDQNTSPKKKKKASGGRPWKLSEKAFLATAREN